MAMKPFDRSQTIQPYGLVSIKRRDLGQLYKSPWIAGKLMRTQTNLGYQEDTNGRFSRVDVMAPDGDVMITTTPAHNLLQVLNNGGLKVPAYSTKLRDDAVVNCYSRIYEKVANVADLIRTRQETVSMAANALRDLRRSYRAIRRGKIKQASHILGIDLHKKPKKADPAGRWLEYSYGWSPLVQDVYNVLDRGFGDISLRVSGRSKNEYNLNHSYSWIGRYPAHRGTGRLYVRERAFCVAFIGIDNTAMSAISTWGLDNPAALAWEALPYSFVVDWFLPIGDYLNDSLNLSGPITIKEMSVTQSLVCALSGTASYRVLPDSYWPSANGDLYVETRKKTRSAGIVSRPLPRFNNPFTSLDRFYNQLALAKAEFSRRS